MIGQVGGRTGIGGVTKGAPIVRLKPHRPSLRFMYRRRHSNFDVGERNANQWVVFGHIEVLGEERNSRFMIERFGPQGESVERTWRDEQCRSAIWRHRIVCKRISQSAKIDDVIQMVVRNDDRGDLAKIQVLAE